MWLSCGVGFLFQFTFLPLDASLVGSLLFFSVSVVTELFFSSDK